MSNLDLLLCFVNIVKFFFLFELCDCCLAIDL